MMVGLDPVYGIEIALACGIGVYYGAMELSYYARKKEIVKRINSGIPFRESNYSISRKIEDCLFLGASIAERSFKKGKFDNEFPDIDRKILKEYKQNL